MNELVQVGLGVELFVAIALLVFAVRLIVQLISRLEGLYRSIDLALVPFGQSGLGRLANQSLRQGRTYVDQPTDMAVIRITDLVSSVTFLAQIAKAAGVEVTADKVAAWGRAVFDALEALTDGVPADGKP
jgi:hypothetical protein